MGAQAACDVKDLSTADTGKRRTEWAFQSMPVLQTIRKHFIKTQPLQGIRIAACLHVTTETANLMICLRDGGASLTLCSPSPLTTQDDVAATLVRDYGISVYAIRGSTNEQYYAHLAAALDCQPNLVLDDGAALAGFLNNKRPEFASQVIGGTEETTTGLIRLKALAKDSALRYPVIAINDAMTKHLFDKCQNGAQKAGLIRLECLYTYGGIYVDSDCEPFRSLEDLLDVQAFASW